MNPGGAGVGSVVRVVARLMLGPSLVLAVGLIVKGFAEAGDGFAAGVVVALAIALNYVALGPDGAEAALPVLRYAPAIALVGLLLALASGFFSLALGEPPLSHRPAPGTPVTRIGTLELFTPLVFDVGVCLLVVGVLTVLSHQLALPDDPPPPPETEQDAAAEVAGDAEGMP